VCAREVSRRSVSERACWSSRREPTEDMARDLFNWESRSVGVHLRQPPNRQVAVVSERSAIRTSAVRLFAAVSVLSVAVAGARFAAPRVLARIFRVRRAGIDLGPADFGVIAEDVTILESNGRLLKGWFAAGPVGDRPRPAVLVIHGWNSAASLMLPIAPLVHAAGMHALFLDACCHGRSDEDRFASMPRFAEDIEAGLRWLRADSRVDPECVTLVGHSVGAGAALLVASRDPRVAAVVSIAAMAHPGTFMREIMHARGMPTPVITLVLRDRARHRPAIRHVCPRLHDRTHPRSGPPHPRRPRRRRSTRRRDPPRTRVRRPCPSAYPPGGNARFDGSLPPRGAGHHRLHHEWRARLS
jgi:pimeloyl-ACP methyl ester carboxylesterase